jgi:undecaprenyl-diphosphatase
MTIPQVLVLSLVEGLTEFLPISSTGHLILTARLLAIPQTEFLKTFEIFIQFGAILAVIVLYFHTLLEKKYLWKLSLVAFIPAAFFGFLFYEVIKGIFFDQIAITIAALILGGGILILFEKRFHKKHTVSIEHMSLSQAMLIGIGQSLSIVPGVSRSAASIISGMLVGLSKKESVEFSFFLAIPTIAAASTFDMMKSSHSFTQHELMLLGIGFCMSFIFALLAIRFFLAIIKYQSFIIFGVYRILLGLLFVFLI